jgi:DNA-binding CsgD family transcriptional regulator
LASAARLPALLLVTSRTAERAAFPDLAARVLARLTGTPRSARWHLGPLATGDVAALVEDGLGVPAPPDLVAETHHRTGGNPLWLTELLATCRAAAEDGPGRLARLATAALPTYLGPPPHPPPPPTTPPPAPRPTAPTVPANGAPANGAPANGAPANGAPANGAPAGVGAVATVAAMEVLTAREREVIRCLAAGMTNQQVARALGISIRTVTVHVSNLFRKTGSASRTEAALWALRQGLAD